MTCLVLWNKVALHALPISIFAVASASVGCSGGSQEKTRANARKNQLVGRYRLKLDDGVEKLELKDHGFYIQDDASNGKKFHHEGRWQLTSHILNGSEVRLVDAMIIDRPADQQLRALRGDILLQVHMRDGKLELARNEVADWYYERLD